jgi:hypothetical protein
MFNGERAEPTTTYRKGTAGVAETRPHLRPRPGARSMAAGESPRTRRRVGGNLAAVIAVVRPVRARCP